VNERRRPVKRAIRRLPTMRRPTEDWKTSTVARAATRRRKSKRTRRPLGRAFARAKPARDAHAAEPVTLPVHEPVAAAASSGGGSPVAGGRLKLSVSRLAGSAIGTSKTGAGPSGSLIVSPPLARKSSTCAWPRLRPVSVGSSRKPCGLLPELGVRSLR
jgi:hypothetical protein